MSRHRVSDDELHAIFEEAEGFGEEGAPGQLDVTLACSQGVDLESVADATGLAVRPLGMVGVAARTRHLFDDATTVDEDHAVVAVAAFVAAMVG